MARMKTNGERHDGFPDDKTPDMKEMGHSGKSNGGMYKTAARFGQTIITPHPLDRSTMIGSYEDECSCEGFSDRVDVDDISHSIEGAKTNNSFARWPGGRKDTTIKPETR